MINKEKEERRKLYQENIKLYKKVRAEFVYGISKSFRQIRKDKIKELDQLEEEIFQSYQEE